MRDNIQRIAKHENYFNTIETFRIGISVFFCLQYEKFDFIYIFYCIFMNSPSTHSLAHFVIRIVSFFTKHFFSEVRRTTQPIVLQC